MSRSRPALGFTAVNDTSYRIFFLLHILSVIVAFAPALVSVLPGGREGALGVIDRAGRIVYSPALILAGLFGIALILLSDDVWEFSDTWVSLAFVVWIAMNGVFHALVLTGRRQNDESKVNNGQAIMTVLLLVMLWIMIWKPGY
jgi:arginine exporter protein ArgO